jgi:hypothetical protein
VPLAALSERTNSHNLGAGVVRHLGCGFKFNVKHSGERSDGFMEEVEQMECIR